MSKPAAANGSRARKCGTLRRLGQSRSQTLSRTPSEKLDHPFAGLVSRLALDFTHLVGQHRVRHFAEAVFIARARVDLDHLERIPESLFERREPFCRRRFVFTESQTHRTQALVRTAIGDGCQFR